MQSDIVNGRHLCGVSNLGLEASFCMSGILEFLGRKENIERKGR